MANLQHLKASRNKILNSLPTRSFGSDGDIVMSRISGRGVYLCTKVNGTWYAADKLQELNNLGKTTIEELITKKLSIKNLNNPNRDTDRFVVSNSGQIGYRTGDDLIQDLELPSSFVDYKTSYCSLGQYTDKESCELNNGTWYYSENDSHDSVSSTAENELLTVGSSLGKLNAEPTLTYDGSQLEIKYNADFDDNWQTSATTELLRLSYDSDNYCRFSVDFTGQTTINTNDSDGVVGHLLLRPDGDLVLDPASQKIIINATDGLYFDGGDHTYIAQGAVDRLDFTVGGTLLFQIYEGITDAIHVNCHLDIDAASKLFFDGSASGHTYISESSADRLDFNVGGDLIIRLIENGTNGNSVDFDTACAGFTQIEPTFDATDTEVDFRHSNKQKLTLTDNCTDIHFQFPVLSGNFVCVLLQDGSGSRTISNWKTKDSAGNAGAGNSGLVLWAGGVDPLNTETADKADIASFYWDADNEIAYGTYTYNF